MIALGLDPGTSNPGLALLSRSATGWSLLRLPILKSLDDLLSELSWLQHSGHHVDVSGNERSNP